MLILAMPDFSACCVQTKSVVRATGAVPPERTGRSPGLIGTIPCARSFLVAPARSPSIASGGVCPVANRNGSGPMNDPHERPVVTEANKADVRAGHTGDKLRYILLGSCALVIIGFVVVALLGR